MRLQWMHRPFFGDYHWSVIADFSAKPGLAKVVDAVRTGTLWRNLAHPFVNQLFYPAKVIIL